ncbi:MAG: M23 family metallopeptidase [Deltaproteobacteria bacterium]|nr:M23 family metallopeptidase [Deltaproteobacteria bacterium]MBW2362979.1 M23 family metallopeptidase [Deltaproteobacteria bacterium]
MLRHDLTLLGLVAVLVAVSAGAITAAVRETEEVAAVVAPFEEELAVFERPAEFEFLALAPALEDLEVIQGAIRRGDTLASVLARHDVPAALVHAIDRGLRPLFDFRRARPGHEFRLAQDGEGGLIEFRYQVSDLEAYLLRRAGDELHAFHEEAELTPKVARIAGVVVSSLHESVVQLGEHGQLANDFSDIFAWDIDFTRTVQPGDEFQILYERLYRTSDAGEEYVRPGRILAAKYHGSAGDLSAYYFEAEEGRGGYYRPDGRSVEGQFLQAPLRYRAITSRYADARHHPILKITRPHHGIDYAAKRGTPVWAVADGKVIYRGRAGGFGNLVKVRHPNGYVSYYSHLQGFAKDVSVGQSVQQKQVLGYVGSTGLATGPHVCFRVARDGKYVNPARVPGPLGPPVPQGAIARFEVERDGLLNGLRGGPMVATQEAL